MNNINKIEQIDFNYKTARNFRPSKIPQNQQKQKQSQKINLSLRRTSYSFNKKIKQLQPNNNTPQDTWQAQLFRKTTLSMKATQKKSSFFDQLLDDDITLNERYKIVGQIGKGSYSKVSSAYDKIKRKTVAVKIYDKINTLEWNNLQNIKRQIQALRKINHQNVVQIYHVIKDKNRLLIFMENCGRQTLSGLLRKGKILEEIIVKKYFQQIIQGVKHLHSKGIYHRDLKPENILIDEKGNLKIIDFGFSSIGKNYLTSYCGTPPFMCPQIVLRKPYLGQKADIWAIGVILFLMLNGRLPFRATTEQQLYRIIQSGKYTFTDETISQTAKRLINKILKTQPQQRLNAQKIYNDKWFKI